MSIEKVSDVLYLTAGKLKNEKGKMVSSPELCPKGSWKYAGPNGSWPGDENLTVDKIGNFKFIYKN